MNDAAEIRSPVSVGVLLAPPPGDLGEWLADAAAFDAAGAYALWLDTAGDPGLDPLAVAAALATLTFRALLVTGAPEPTPESARTLATIGRLSRGRLALYGERARPDAAAPQVFHRVDDGPFERTRADAAGPQVFHRVDDGIFERTRADGEPERWVRISSPDGRAAWHAAVAEVAAGGADGLLVPAGPRLLDILRNPDSPGDRHDLHLAQG